MSNFTFADTEAVASSFRKTRAATYAATSRATDDATSDATRETRP